MAPCFELVIYHLKPGKEDAFQLIHFEVQGELAKLPGFIDIETATSVDDVHVRVDTVRWRDPASAKAAFRAFSSFPQAKAFMELVEKVIFSGHFTAKDKREQ